jgi:hypothetical protein
MHLATGGRTEQKYLPGFHYIQDPANYIVKDTVKCNRRLGYHTRFTMTYRGINRDSFTQVHIISFWARYYAFL